MRRPRPSDPKWSDVTPAATAPLARRAVLSGGTALLAAAALGAGAAHGYSLPANVTRSQWSTDEDPNSWDDITTYNNFYEFGLDKADPARHAHLETAVQN